jgi:UDP-N-acetylmuramoyl-tripeptide--D-alanyl-D-alanine ligase
MKKGMTLRQAAQWMGMSIGSDQMAYGASVDSRLTKKDDLFFACPGKINDGHEFLFEASKKGAIAAVVSQDYSGDHFGLQLIRVAQPEKALQQLAKKFLAHLSTKVVAITGSAGKTTTKNFLARLLAQKYRVASTPGNYNSQLGLPLTLLNHVSGDEEYAVLEMGMTQAGHIASLVQIAPPDIALLTGVSLAHAENFASLEEIGLAKAEIFSHPKTKKGILDLEIVNYQAIVQKAGHCELISFGCNSKDAEYSLIVNSEAMSILRKGHKVCELDLLAFPGTHNRHNFLAAAIAAHKCGVSWESISGAIPSLSLPPMRLQIDQRQGILFVNDSYNALPIAVKGALESLPLPQRGGRKIAVLSEMRELGAFSEQCHKEVAEFSLSRVDKMLCLGAGCAPMHAVWQAAGRGSSIVWVLDLTELVTHLKSTVREGDVVLVKGSRASGLSGLLDHFETD